MLGITIRPTGLPTREWRSSVRASSAMRERSSESEASERRTAGAGAAYARSSPRSVPRRSDCFHFAYSAEIGSCQTIAITPASASTSTPSTSSA